MADLQARLPRAEGYAEMHQRLTGVLAPAALPENGSDERVAYLDGLLAALDAHPLRDRRRALQLGGADKMQGAFA